VARRYLRSPHRPGHPAIDYLVFSVIGVGGRRRSHASDRAFHEQRFSRNPAGTGCWGVTGAHFPHAARAPGRNLQLSRRLSEKNCSRCPECVRLQPAIYETVLLSFTRARAARRGDQGGLTLPSKRKAIRRCRSLTSGQTWIFSTDADGIDGLIVGKQLFG